MEPRGTTRLGAYALCRRGDGAVLLARMGPGTVDEGRWTLPGGGVEFGEHPDDAVLRELLEETGLTGERGPVVAVWSRTYPSSRSRPGVPFQHLGLVYAVRALDGVLVHESGGTTDRCAWVLPQERPAHPLVALAAFALDGAP